VKLISFEFSDLSDLSSRLSPLVGSLSAEFGKRNRKEKEIETERIAFFRQFSL
jgi:hypothetical protein